MGLAQRPQCHVQIIGIILDQQYFNALIELNLNAFLYGHVQEAAVRRGRKLSLRLPGRQLGRLEQGPVQL
jgi:hypothetical protein